MELSLLLCCFIILALLNSNTSENDEIITTESFNIAKELSTLGNETKEINQNIELINTKLQGLTNTFQTKLDELISVEKEKNNLTALQLYGITIAISVPFVVFIISRYVEKKSILTRSSKSLHREINDNLEALEGKKGYQVVTYKAKEHRTSKDFQVRYTNAFLDYEIYESIISSGELTHFERKTQYYVTYIYTRIKNHNETINYTNEFEDRYFMEGEDKEKKKRWDKEIEKYEISLSKWETEILEKIPMAIEALDQEMKRKFV